MSDRFANEFDLTSMFRLIICTSKYYDDWKFLQSSQKSETSRSNLKRAYIYFLIGCLRIPTDDLIASIVLNFSFVSIELPKMSTDIQSDCLLILRKSVS